MQKFHINTKDGTVGPCSAKHGKCPFGSDAEHFTSMVAAAQAYEKSMAEGSLAPISKSGARKEEVKSAVKNPGLDENYGLDLKLDPTPYRIADDPDFRPGDVKPEFEALYENLRSSTPALVHRDASNMLYCYGELSGQDRLDFAKFADANPDMDYNTALATYFNQHPTVSRYNKFLTTKELNDSLLKRTRDAIFASRPYGFPEDEMSRSNMDAYEHSLRKVVAKASGKTDREITNLIRDAEPLDRPKSKLSDAELKDRMNHIRGLSRPNKNHKKELLQLQQETNYREIETLRAAITDDLAFYRAAAPAVEDRRVSHRTVRQLGGAPTPEVFAAMTDDEREMWDPKYSWD